MKIFGICLFILMITVFTVSAQTNTTATEAKPYIEVTGKAEKEVIPDEIYITITIWERNEGKEKITIEKQEADLKQAITDLQIPVENLSLADANANYISINWRKEGVMARAKYLLKVNDAAMVRKVYDKMAELNIDHAEVTKVSHSHIEELKKETRIMAIKAAKEKATYLLEAIGEQPGKPIIVTEIADPLRRVYISGGTFSNNGGTPNIGYNDSDVETDTIQYRKIKLESSVYVKFEIR